MVSLSQYTPALVFILFDLPVQDKEIETTMILNITHIVSKYLLVICKMVGWL